MLRSKGKARMIPVHLGCSFLQPHLEAVTFELDFAESDLENTLKRLDTWVQNQDVPSVVPQDTSYLHKVPGTRAGNTNVRYSYGTVVHSKCHMTYLS